MMASAQMEPVSRLIGKLPLSGSSINPEDIARAAWPLAVGKKVAAHTCAARMVRTRLIVEVEDNLWQRNLFGLTGQILKNLGQRIGPGIVEEIEFRVVPRRMGPQRAAESVRSRPAPLFDEADAIADPILRRIYRENRRKAQA